MLSLCVHPSVCHKAVLYWNNSMNQALVFGMDASFHLSYSVLWESWASPEIMVLPSGTLCQTPDSENFATASQSRCQQNSLSLSSSMVELIDDTNTTIDESWLFTASRSTVPSNSITSICCGFFCTTCFCSWHDFDWHSMLHGLSALAEFLVLRLFWKWTGR